MHGLTADWPTAQQRHSPWTKAEQFQTIPYGFLESPCEIAGPPGISDGARWGGHAQTAREEYRVRRTATRATGACRSRVLRSVHERGIDSFRHEQLVREMQAVRGAIYLDEGNVKHHQLSADGRHQTPEDERSWHLLWTDGGGHVTSCAWYLEHENTTSIRNLRVRHCPLDGVDEWRDKLHGAVESEIARARRDGLRYAEVGGWLCRRRAGARRRDCAGPCGLRSLPNARRCARNHDSKRDTSSSILRRLGGSHLEFNGMQMPAYFDPDTTLR